MEMPFRHRPRRIARLYAVAALVVLPLTAACSANFSAPTQQQYQPAVGSDDREGQVYALNMLVVADGSGDGTMVGTLINQEDCPDYLVDLLVVDRSGGGVKASPLPSAESLTAPDGCPPVTAPSTGIALPSQLSTRLPDDGQIQISAATVTPGTFVTVTMRFVNAGPIELDLPVVANTGDYAGITVGPLTGTQ